MNSDDQKTRKAIVITSILLGLFCLQLTLSDFVFANSQYEHLRKIAWCLLLVPIPVVIWFCPKSICRKICLLISIPVAILFGLVALAGSFERDHNYLESCKKSIPVNNLTFSLVLAKDVTYDSICDSKIELRVERNVLGGLMKQRLILLEILPALTADMVVDGRHELITVSAPALENRKAISMVYSTNWESLTKHPRDKIKMPAQ